MNLTNRKLPAKAIALHAAVVVGLVLIAILTIYRSFSEFGFYYDDWRFLQEALQTGSVGVVFPARPLHQPLTEWVFNAIGFNPSTGYIMLAVLLVASVLAMYWLMNVLFPRRQALAVIATAAYLLYPGDLSRTWITAGLTANRPAVLLALVSLGLTFTALRLRKRSSRVFYSLLTTAVLIYLASLLLYEVQALLVPAFVFAGSIWIAMSGRGLVHRNATRKTLLSAVILTAPFVAVFAGVLVWRSLFLQPGVDDRFMATANFSPLYLARQLIGVYYFNFVEQPLEVVVRATPFLGRVSAFTVLMAVAGAGLITGPVWIFVRHTGPVPRVSAARSSYTYATALSNGALFYRNLSLVLLGLTGIVYAVLLPHDHIISVSGLDGPFVSRLNAAGAVVVSMAAAAVVMFAWTWAAAFWRAHSMRINTAAASGLAVAVVLLVAFHGIVQDDYAEAWQMQQRYTQQVVDSVPAVEPGTHFHFYGTPSTYGSSYVFMYSVEHMLRLVYGDPTITATSTAGKDDRYVLNRDGLHLDGELLASADRVWHFTLFPDGCTGKLKPGCGRLVVSPPSGHGESHFVSMTSADYDWPELRELLGISLPAKMANTQQGSGAQQPQFSAPSDPPGN